MPYLVVEHPGGERLRLRLDRPRVRVGRSHTNELVLSDDQAASRHHAEFTKQGEDVFVRDLDSKGGTTLNGTQLWEPTALQPRDRIEIGNTVILFLRDQDEEPPEPNPALDRLDSMDTVVIPLSEAVSMKSDTATVLERGPVETTPQARAFAVLSQATEELIARRPMNEVLDMVMDMVFRATFPDRGALMLLEGDPPVPRLRSVRGSAADKIHVSRTIADMVLHHRQSVLMSDPRRDQRFAGAESIHEHEILSAMCVPLWDNRDIIGLVYVDRLLSPEGFTRDDLQLLTLVANVGAVKIENSRLYLREQQMREMEQELATAAKIQRHLLPAAPPEIPGYEVTGCNLPCREVGGDYYDFRLRDGGNVVLAIGDVSGKGIGAALLTGAVQAGFRANLATGAALPAVVSSLNESVLTSSASEHFVTFFCGELDPESGVLRYVNAGHNPPLLFRSDEKVEELPSTGLVLGVRADIAYREGEVTLTAGDLLVLYSDGITETRNPSGEEFEPAGLIHAVHAVRTLSATELQKRILEAVDSFSGQPTAQFDDITLVLLRRESGAPQERYSGQS